ncbi:MAG: aminotransferase class V-fold PLP-dependent enzyme [Holophagales bacterium]|nr:aminotransferase class V-fold PLP-dependent enzyme [Holophagales bacterium]
MKVFEPVKQFSYPDPPARCLLLVPGPVNVDETVRSALLRPDICHRENAFSGLLRNVEDRLLEMLEIRRRRDFRSVIISGSGTAANEAVLGSIVGDSRILVLANGEFGERLHRISSLHNRTALLDFGWSSPIDLEQVERCLDSQKTRAVAMVHHETSVGRLNPIEEVGKACARRKIRFFVDCVSSVGADRIDLERSHISFCSGSASKAIGSYPGLSFVVGRKECFESLALIPPKVHYLDLHRFYRSSCSRAQTPNTPAVQLIYALEAALRDILEEGVENRRQRILALATYMRSRLRNLGLRLTIEPGEPMSSLLSTVMIPPELDFRRFKEHLAGEGIFIYEGKGPLAGRVFQVGHIGNLALSDADRFFECLESFLGASESGPRRDRGELRIRALSNPDGSGAVELRGC